MNFRDVTFAHPEYVWLMLVAVIPFIGGRTLQACLLAGTLVFAIFALMAPQGGGDYKGEPVTVSASEQEYQLMVDVSLSMGENGQLKLAKEIADAFVNRLNGEQVSLYAFTKEPVKLSPATTDYLFVRQMISQLDHTIGEVAGTDLTAALRKIPEGKYPSTIILLSDGGEEPLPNFKEYLFINTKEQLDTPEVLVGEILGEEKVKSSHFIGSLEFKDYFQIPLICSLLLFAFALKRRPCGI